MSALPKLAGRASVGAMVGLRCLSKSQAWDHLNFYGLCEFYVDSSGRHGIWQGPGREIGFRANTSRCLQLCKRLFLLPLGLPMCCLLQPLPPNWLTDGSLTPVAPPPCKRRLSAKAKDERAQHHGRRASETIGSQLLVQSKQKKVSCHHLSPNECRGWPFYYVGESIAVLQWGFWSNWAPTGQQPNPAQQASLMIFLPTLYAQPMPACLPACPKARQAVGGKMEDLHWKRKRKGNRERERERQTAPDVVSAGVVLSSGWQSAKTQAGQACSRLMTTAGRQGRVSQPSRSTQPRLYYVCVSACERVVGRRACECCVCLTHSLTLTGASPSNQPRRPLNKC
ncbi:hypothetical protein MAPG_10370, partial [Magnaporthiopsis poae ATCC 64411]